MSEETKTYRIVTFSCHGGHYQADKAEIEGVRLFDWVKANAPVPLERIADIAAQILTILLRRDICGYSVMRGYCNPFMFAIEPGGTVQLIDLSDQSNQALGRKIRTKSVTRCFYPPDTGEYDGETAELFGFARTVQFMMAANEKAGAVFSKKDTRRWQQYLDNCAGEGLRRIRDFEHAERGLNRISRGSAHTSIIGRESKDKGVSLRPAGRLLRFAVSAAAVLFLVLAVKTGLDGMREMRRDYETRYSQMSERIVQLETQVEILEEKQKAERH